MFEFNQTMYEHMAIDDDNDDDDDDDHHLYKCQSKCVC